jgi:hypothetical protein
VSHHGMLLPFDTEGLPEKEDWQFCRGFEAGHVWTKLRESDERTFTAHAANAEMMLRIGEALDLAVSSEDMGDEWMEVTFEDLT